jgi:hypothetical protein
MEVTTTWRRASWQLTWFDDMTTYVDDDVAAYMDDDAAAYMDDDVAIDVAMMTSSPYQFRDGPILGPLFQ